MSNQRTIHLIVNPASGRRCYNESVDKVKAALQKANCRHFIHRTEYAKHSNEIIKNIHLDPEDAVAVLGGDGTIHNVVNGMMQRHDQINVPLAIIPGGTGNDIAATLGIASVEDAIQKLVRGKLRTIDLGYITTTHQRRYLILCLLWGYAYDLAAFADRHRWMGNRRYTLSGYIQFLCQQSKYLKIIIDGNLIENSFRFFMIVNSPRAGNSKLIAPNALLDDGKFDLVLVPHVSRWHFFRTMLSLQQGKIARSPYIEFYQFKELQLMTNVVNDINLDSEWIMQTPASISVVPHALRVYV